MNAILAAQIIVNAWDGWTEETCEASRRSDNILQAAVGYAAALLHNAPHQIPEEVRPHFAAAVAVMTDDPTLGMPDVPNLTFDEALAPLRAFVAGDETVAYVVRLLETEVECNENPVARSIVARIKR